MPAVRVWLRALARPRWSPSLGGLAMAAVSYAVLMRPPPESIGDFFLLRALSEGGGSNVVNVLLVDFRGFDTLGEITVLAIVALTVYALLRRFRPAPESIAMPAQQANDVDPASAPDARRAGHQRLSDGPRRLSALPAALHGAGRGATSSCADTTCRAAASSPG